MVNLLWILGATLDEKEKRNCEMAFMMAAWLGYWTDAGWQLVDSAYRGIFDRAEEKALERLEAHPEETMDPFKQTLLNRLRSLKLEKTEGKRWNEFQSELVLTGDVTKYKQHPRLSDFLSSKDLYRRTPLMLAVINGHKRAIEDLGKMGVNLHDFLPNGLTLLDFSARYSKEMFLFLLLKGLPASSQLLIAVVDGPMSEAKEKIDIIQRCFRKDDFERMLNAHRLSDGATPLHIAVERGDLALEELLISLGADVNAVDLRGRRPRDLLLSQEGPSNAGNGSSDLMRRVLKPSQIRLHRRFGDSQEIIAGALAPEGPLITITPRASALWARTTGGVFHLEEWNEQPEEKVEEGGGGNPSDVHVQMTGPSTSWERAQGMPAYTRGAAAR